MSNTHDQSYEGAEQELGALRALTRREKGRLFVLSGPSGVGKDAVLENFEQLAPGVLNRCVTMTTRSPRPGEIDGVDYHFATVDEFRQLIDQEELLEWAMVHGNYYGTPRRWVQEQLAVGKNIVLKIDVQGGLAVREKMEEVVMIFVAPPSFEELERRLRGRCTETEDDLCCRLENARKELRFIPDYDYLVINDTLEGAVSELEDIIGAERCRVHPAP